MSVVDVSPRGSGPSACPGETGDLQPSSMLVVKYETDGLHLAGEVYLRRSLDRGLSRRSSDALSEDVCPHRIDHFDATMALFETVNI